MSYQFAHLETYSRKSNKRGQSTAFVFDEASRVPSACLHVENPQPPTVLFGMSVDELRHRHDTLADTMRTTRKDGREQKIRTDQHTLATLILSYPSTEMTDDVLAWEQRSIQWMKDKYGDSLVSVVRHSDESYMHMHAYLLPENLRARSLHPGVQAKELALAALALSQTGLDGKSVNKLGDKAYRDAMRSWQDDYWQHVGISSGLTRLGPGRRRLSTADAKIERAQVRRIQTETDRLEHRESKVVNRESRVQNLADNLSIEIESSRAEVEQQRQVVTQLMALAVIEHDQAISLQERVKGWARRQMAAIKADLAAAAVAKSDALKPEKLGRRLGRIFFGFHSETPKELDKKARKAVHDEVTQQVTLRHQDAMDVLKAKAEHAQTTANRAQLAETQAYEARAQKHDELARERQARLTAELSIKDLKTRLVQANHKIHALAPEPDEPRRGYRR